MSDHQPECYLSGPPNLCPTCEALRACEQRVFQEQIKGRQHDMVMAYLRGLDAAREAVAYLEENDWAVYDSYQKALAAIDALRGSGNPHTPPSAEKGEQA